MVDPTTLCALQVASRRVADRRDFARFANSTSRPLLQRFLPDPVPECAASRGGIVWGMDALLLRGRTGWCDLAEMIVPDRPRLLAGENLPAQPRQQRSLDKQVKLKAAALALFSEKGFEGTSIDDIAGRAGLAVGGFYLHFRSKRQLLLVLMDELLDQLSRIDLRPKAALDMKASIQAFLSRAFATDLQFLGAYRAWREAALTDTDLARKEHEIHAWTTARVTMAFTLLRQLPGARTEVDVPGLARVMDSFFWTLLAQATLMPDAELDQWVAAATHLIYHALFTDAKANRTRTAPKT